MSQPALLQAGANASSSSTAASLGSARSSQQQPVPLAAVLGGFQAAGQENVARFWRSEARVPRG